MSCLYQNIDGKLTKHARVFTGIRFKCDACGRFIPFSDLDDGSARHEMITPDSDCSSEEWETLCKECNK